MSEVVAEGTNAAAWEGATRNTKLKPEYVTPPAAAAKEILDDPHWAAKIRRALAQSEAGQGISLEEHRKSL